MNYKSTDKEINACIAKACRWTPKPLSTDIPPDYCNDLNAMHEVWLTIKPNVLKTEYGRVLKRIAWTSEQPEAAPMNATARQRAEAFLRTIGEWKD